MYNNGLHGIVLGLKTEIAFFFVKGLHGCGIIYKGNYIVNWCPRCGTALADDEVDHEDTAGAMYHLYYELNMLF